MRILYSHRIQSHDGQSVHLEELIAAFRSLGHEVHVVGPRFYENSNFGGESKLVAAARRLLPGHVAEVAELAYNFPIYGRLAAAARELKPDLIYERYNLYFLAGAVLARRLNMPYFLEVNGPLAEERTRYGGLRLRRIAARAEAFVWQSADCVLSVTDVLKKRIVAAGVDSARVRVVPNGVALARYPIRPPRPPGPIVLGFVGFAREWHGLDAVISGLAIHPNRSVRFVVVGPVQRNLVALAEKLGLSDRLLFTGLVPHEQVSDTIAEFDIALQPKAVEYASPLKIFDYMAAGRAIVAPDQPNIREVLTDGATAMLFDPAQPETMWRAIESLIDDAALRVRLGAAARAELERRDFTWLGNAQRILGWADGIRRGS